MAQVLVVDDEPASASAMKALLGSLGHTAVVAASGAEALLLLDGVGAVITGFALPGMDGLQLLEKCRERDETLPVILVTAHGSERIAVRAMKRGAYEYVTKPYDLEEMSLAVTRALEARGLRLHNRFLVAERAIGQPVAGDSPAMRRLLDAVARVAPKDVNVLVRGERGTGKQLIAGLIHAQSPRAAAPFVRFNCAAIAGKLAEAELFGYVRGAFAGASQARTGAFAQADRGVLMLEEVGELPLALQDELLRVLQEGEIQPLGAARVEKVDVRVVASTSGDLAADVKEGRFRSGLYYRLSTVEILVPPLRERRKDIPALLEIFARRYRERFGAEEVRLSPGLVRVLAAADWPGNLGELENAVSHLVALAPPGELGPEAFSAPAAERAPAPVDAAAPPASGPAGIEPVEAAPPRSALPRWQHLEAVERGLIVQMISATGGNQSAAARRLGLSRSALIQRLKKYGLSHSSADPVA
jgi:two-component system response regulator AtoC